MARCVLELTFSVWAWLTEWRHVHSILPCEGFYRLEARGTHLSSSFDDGHHRQLPRLTGGPFRYKTYASDYLQRSSKNAGISMKTVSTSILELPAPKIRSAGRDRPKHAEPLVSA